MSLGVESPSEDNGQDIGQDHQQKGNAMINRPRIVLAAAFVIAGLLYAVGSAHPTFSDSLKHSHCCGPQPENIRTYLVPFVEASHIVIIPEVEGPNGFVLTDVLAETTLHVYQDTGDGPVQLLKTNADVNLTTGFPLVPGAIITVNNPGVGGSVTLIGYVH